MFKQDTFLLHCIIYTHITIYRNVPVYVYIHVCIHIYIHICLLFVGGPSSKRSSIVLEGVELLGRRRASFRASLQQWTCSVAELRCIIGFMAL